jgi:hypothetical protein
MQSHRAVLIVGIMSLGMVTTTVSQSHTQATAIPGEGATWPPKRWRCPMLRHVT